MSEAGFIACRQMRNKAALELGPSTIRLSRWKSAFGNSSRGFSDAWRLEPAFRVEVAALALLTPLAVLIGSDAFKARVLVASVIFVLVVEVLNTIIETIVDRVGLEKNERSRIAKDLGSLAVLLACILAATIWLGALYEAFGAAWMARPGH